MALLPCPECKRDVSDRAPTCPHCGYPLKTTLSGSPSRMVTMTAVVALALAGGAALFALKRPREDYSQVEQYRADQDAQGTDNEAVRQRFYRLYESHPDNAMYLYLWARCVDDATKQLELANRGIKADPGFSWSYNMASRALARLNRVPEAYEQAVKGASIDPGNYELARKTIALKQILDHKLVEQPKPAPNGYVTFENKDTFEKSGVRYQGLFRAVMQAPDGSDLKVMEKTRAASYQGPMADAVRGFRVCANPFADNCLRVYVARDARFGTAWQHGELDVGSLKENQLVTVKGAIVTNGKGENVMLADSITADPL